MQIDDSMKATVAAAMHIAIETWTEDQADCEARNDPLAEQFARQIEHARTIRDEAEA